MIDERRIYLHPHVIRAVMLHAYHACDEGFKRVRRSLSFEEMLRKDANDRDVKWFTDRLLAGWCFGHAPYTQVQLIRQRFVTMVRRSIDEDTVTDDARVELRPYLEDAIIVLVREMVSRREHNEYDEPIAEEIRAAVDKVRKSMKTKTKTKTKKVRRV